MLGGVGGGVFFSSIFHANQMEMGDVFFFSKKRSLSHPCNYIVENNGKSILSFDVFRQQNCCRQYKSMTVKKEHLISYSMFNPLRASVALI